jgi:hypothetical protein
VECIVSAKIALAFANPGMILVDAGMILVNAETAAFAVANALAEENASICECTHQR